jgi:Transcriptional regulators
MEEILLDSLQNVNKPLAEQVAELIIYLITNQKLKPYEKLPNEFELAKQLNVGRGTVREAVKLLVSNNVLVIKRGKGTFVAENTGIANDPLGLTFVQDKIKAAKDLWEVRNMIEPRTAALSAQNATEEEIRQMYVTCKEMENGIKNVDNYTDLEIDLDVKLHTQIAQSSKNQILLNLVPIINYGVKMFNEVTKNILAKETVLFHYDIVDAIAKHDATTAYTTMEKHLLSNLHIIESKQINK